MRVQPGLLAAALVSLALASPARAQDAPKQAPSPVLRVLGFGGDGIQPSESIALQNLVTSYVIELKMFRVIDEAGQELAFKEAETAMQLGVTKDLAPLAADYILSGRASRIGSVLVFTMDVTRTTSGEKKSVADTFASVNDLILAARRLTRGLFERQPEAAQAPAPAATNPAPSLAQVSGTWKGDKNVDRVTILPDGRGFAVLASGARMAVKATIEGVTVVVLQNQPNSPEFYRPGLDLKSARIVAASARPWRWVFALSADGSSLAGVKESVFVTVSDKGAVTLDNGYVRDSTWKRLYR